MLEVRDLHSGYGEAVVVRVIGEQFSWNIHYPGPDGKFGRTDLKLVTADNPLGLDRSDPNAKDEMSCLPERLRGKIYFKAGVDDGDAGENK